MKKYRPSNGTEGMDFLDKNIKMIISSLGCLDRGLNPLTETCLSRSYRQPRYLNRRLKMKEEWKQIKGYEGKYDISSCGRVKSHVGKKNNHYGKDIILKNYLGGSGYLFTNLCKNGKHIRVTIHHLVWDHFGRHKRDGRRLQVDHIDNNKQNNNIDNLQILTARENSHKYAKTQSKTSKYIGVSWDRRIKKWRAEIRINNNPTYLGYFDTEKSAHVRYKQALNKIKEL